MTTNIELLSDDDLRKSASAHLRKALRQEPRLRSAEFRRVADILVELRSRALREDGSPDWAGNSYAYRNAVRDIYAAAGLPPDGQTSVKASIRYHVGNALRERVNADELTDAGLMVETPRERHFTRQNPRTTKADRDRLASDTVASISTLSERLRDLPARDAFTSADRARIAKAARSLQAWLRDNAETIE